jgi:drug/metabolite transporter (DMT)-like permease
MDMRTRAVFPAESVAAGIGLGVLAYSLFSVHDATVKWLAADYTIWQVLACRSLVIVVACLAIGRVGLVERARATPLKRQLVFRGAVTLMAWFCYYSASRSMPLAQMTSLYFAAPVIVTLMAAPLLGERVTRRRWICVGIGFIGVMLTADPFGVRLSAPALLVLLAATLWSYGVILMRQIARRESSLLQMLYSNVFFLAVTAIGSAFTWRAPADWTEGLLLGAIGIVGGLGQYAMFEAARRAPASVIATVEYTALLGAFLLGFLIWGDIPALMVWLGAALIVIAGCVLVVGERARA